LRINPNIDAATNPHISTGLYTTKFGIAESDTAECLRRLEQARHCDLVGLACHIGSQIDDLDPFRQAARRMVELAAGLKKAGRRLELLDLGGGLGIDYLSPDRTPAFADYAATLLHAVRPTGLKLVVEPGRCLVGNAGVLLTRVIRLKATPAKQFVVVDGAMNDLIRPCLYDAYHEIEPAARPDRPKALRADVVGPVCETADFLARDRQLPALEKGELLVVRSCGAYGATMASNYNSRPRAPEILVEGSRARIVRPRETLESLWSSEVV
jgi:diaminopimelate decarboxylase